MILSSAENYHQIPPVCRPTTTQISVPHSAAIEFCPLPQIRDALCQNYRHFVAPLADNLSCNWPHDVESCIEHISSSGNLVLSKEFWSHVSDQDNWSVSSGIFDTFPECRGFIKTTS
jgi:hypothetical protein